MTRSNFLFNGQCLIWLTNNYFLFHLWREPLVQNWKTNSFFFFFQGEKYICGSLMRDTELKLNNYQGLKSFHLKKQTKPKAIHLNEGEKNPRIGDVVGMSRNHTGWFNGKSKMRICSYCLFLPSKSVSLEALMRVNLMIIRGPTDFSGTTYMQRGEYLCFQNQSLHSHKIKQTSQKGHQCSSLKFLFFYFIPLTLC